MVHIAHVVEYGSNQTNRVISSLQLEIVNQKFGSYMALDAAGMQGYRTRNQNGQLRDKRNDTHMGTIEKKYHLDLNVRSDMHLGTFLEKFGIKLLNDLITGK